MATFSDLVTLINLKFPDTGVAITPGDVREVLTAMAASNAGVKSVRFIATSASATHTISDAQASVMVMRNGVQENAVTFNSSTHTWTFSVPLSVDEDLTFIYS